MPTIAPVILKSKEDRSVNFVLPSGAEARYVRRSDDYFIAYLSSHNGCSQACRMCHLTQTKQTAFEPEKLGDLLNQARQVFDYYKRQVWLNKEVPARLAHINFMARGEPLLSPILQNKANWTGLACGLDEIAHAAQVDDMRVNISTIMPEGINYLPSGSFTPRIYYSLYSLNKDFRRRWLPNAMHPTEALEMLCEWQGRTKGEVVLHWALIEGENDSLDEAHDIGTYIKFLKLKTRFNLVRYNPFSHAQGRESSMERINSYFEAITQYMRVDGSKIVGRVGFDVSASCGMFIDLKAQHGQTNSSVSRAEIR